LSTNITFISTSFRNRKKERPRRAFWPVSQRFQINVIFTDNVCILCLSCNVKKSKTTANLPENIRNKRHSNRLPWMVSSITIALILVQFLYVALHESGTRKTIFWWVVVCKKKYPVSAIWLLK
jgi:hypothetical protein